ncbi:MAG TPA: phosphate transport system regulatory protein PhoU [Dehalococcoidia bacterium]|nr:phosphate transport system regulatory protein PhoU [Dehalococcoidia bacterium]
MTREKFQQQLQSLHDEVLNMGSMVGKAIMRSVEALKQRDVELAKKVIDDDDLINKKRFEIEEMCVQLMVTQQPMACDLRAIVSVFSIIIDLERIGDHAAGIAKIAIMIGQEPPLKPLIDIPRMAIKVEDMLKRSLDSFINRDAETAKKIPAEDDEVDNLYNQIFRELISFMVEDPRTITRATRLLWVAHNLERSGDRVTNICERVVFIVTGKMEEIGASKY